MATLELEREQVVIVNAEAQKHNAMIKERYRRLQDAEYNQFARETQSVRASVLAPEAPVAPTIAQTPAVEQMPQITQYVPKRAETSVFTTEKFTAVENHVVEMPIAPVQTAQAPVEVYAPAAVQQEEYMLTGMAKKALAVFGATVVAMMSVIGVNSYVIRQKTVRIQNLQQKKEQLLEANEELQRRLEIATSDDTIAEYAQSQGMILDK